MTTDPNTAPTWQWRGPDAAKAAARYRERYHVPPPSPQEQRDHQGVTLAFALLELTHTALTPGKMVAEKVTNDTGDAGQMGLQW